VTASGAQIEAARLRMDEIRRALAGTTDAAARVRLRVRLADVLAVHGDGAAASAELKQAVAEAPVSAGLLFAVRALAARLGPEAARALTAAVAAARGEPAVPTKPAPAGDGRLAPAERRIPSAKSGAPPRQAPAAPAPAAVRAAPPPSEAQREQPAPPPARPPRAPDPVAAALAALVEGKPVRARRLGEEAARLPGVRGAERLGDLVVALREHGANRQALLLARTLAETGGAAAPPGAGGVAALVAEAEQIGARDLADRWRTDLGAASAPAAARERDGQAASSRAAAAGAALAAAERASVVLLPPKGSFAQGVKGAERGSASRIEFLRASFDDQSLSDGERARLAVRLVAALREAGDPTAAVAVLDRALAVLAPTAETASLLHLRAELLRLTGRIAELAAALEAEAETATGPARATALAERAAILDGLGEPDRALEIRLEALVVSPAEPALLEAARRRLEATGRLDRSLELATAALPHVSERGPRARLLRDLATLAEAAAGDRKQAAAAWLEVLSLLPDDAAATEAAERLLRELGDSARLAAFLGWSAARLGDPEARLPLLWKLAEVRRSALGQPEAALPLYREIAGARRSGGDTLPFPPDDWQRRDDALAFHTARALAAPSAGARGEALVARALVLLEIGRLDEADRDLARALDFDPGNSDAVLALERIYERKGDWRGLRARLQARAAATAAGASTHLLLGMGRASERLGDAAAARVAYERALATDESSRPVLAALRQLALARGDYPEAVRLLEREAPLARAPAERAALLCDLAALVFEKLGRGPRAIEILDAALTFEPGNARALEALYGIALTAGSWEKAHQALETMLSAGVAVADASERYYRLGRAAEAAGQPERALGLYSRSYARNPAFRPTLERLSDICFDRQQWDNAWKATEHLIERHGSAFSAPERAALALRSALADLHVAQRLAAQGRIGSMFAAGKGNDSGVRDVADSWASMRFEPRLLAGAEGDRRSRALARLAEVLALTEILPDDPSRAGARETLAALALVDRRWADAVSLLDGLGSERTLDARRRCLFLVAAGDVLLFHQRDTAGAAARYRRARALHPDEPRLTRPNVAQLVADPVGGIEL
jgi:tetratricopeptide (TPR) repeat protein